MAIVAIRPRLTAWALLLSLLVSGVGFAEATFSGLDLADDNRLLFRSTVEVPDFGEYPTLFLGDVEEKQLEQLTFFPERMSILPDTGQLQIQNRYGVFRSDENLENIAPVEDFPSFVGGQDIRSGKVAPIRTSPDGRFVVFMREESPAFGSLVLKDLDNGKEVIVSKDIELDLAGPPVKWAPSSEFFIYSKQNTLYYFSVTQLAEDRVIAEEFRDLGAGTAESASWAADGSLYYVSGSLVYRIRDLEFFPRTLYQELLQVGDIVGKVPFVFDPNFDSFWIAPDGQKILFNKGGRNVFLFYLRGDDYITTGNTVAYPYLFLPRNTRVRRVTWSSIGTVTILTAGTEKGRMKTSLYRMSIPSEPADIDVSELDGEGVRDIVLSPNDRWVAVLYANRVEVRNYERWELDTDVEHRDPLHLIWRGSNAFVVGGSSRIEQVNRRGTDRRLIALSEPDGFGFHRESGEILVLNSGDVYRYAEGDFESVETFSVRAPKVASDAFRVYLETLDSGSYNNIVMVRRTEGVGTTRLFSPPERGYEPIPEEGEPVDFTNFSHGSRTRSREVSFGLFVIGLLILSSSTPLIRCRGSRASSTPSRTTRLRRPSS